MSREMQVKLNVEVEGIVEARKLLLQASDLFEQLEEVFEQLNEVDLKVNLEAVKLNEFTSEADFSAEKTYTVTDLDDNLLVDISDNNIISSNSVKVYVDGELA